MFDLNNGPTKAFKQMIGLQIGFLVLFVVTGGLIAVFSHQFILDVLPANEWSPIIGWGIAAIGGYFFGAVIVSVLVFAVIGLIASD